jgi:AraC family transcriptional regulator of adaptative response/methylated-DNA-[protein]-cysteine methyltransferase
MNPSHLKDTFTQSSINTPLGPMIAIASDSALYLLEFMGNSSAEQKITRQQAKTGASFVLGENPIITSIKTELANYFNGRLDAFKTPLCLLGTTFQQTVWKALCNTTPGETLSYQSLATSIGKPSACRAVANANRTNQLAIVIPCHRIIQSNGQLGGYAGGAHRKQQLIFLEKTLYLSDTALG